MNNEKNKTNEILNSLDGIRKATTPDFFYTRLKARMEKGYEPVGKKQGVLRPVFAFAALAVVLLINAAVIFKKESGNEVISNNDNDSIQSIAAEYRLNEVVSLYDLNQEK